MTTIDTTSTDAPFDTASDPTPTHRRRVWRIEVHPVDAADDPAGRAVKAEVDEQQLSEALREVRTTRIYLVQAALADETVHRIARELLTDPVTQRYRLGSSPRYAGAACVEVHYLPGVMDPVAQSTTDAIADMLGEGHDAQLEVRTGTRYDLFGATRDESLAAAHRLLANTVVQSVHDRPHWPMRFVAGTPYEFKLVHVPIRDLDDAGLMTLSRDGHLFLSLEEMTCVRDYYRSVDRDPTDVELETLAQTWSEHCVHKTLKSRIRYTEAESASPRAEHWSNRPGHTLAEDGSLVIDNLLKSTIAAATNQLIADGLDWCISVFVDNAGIIRFDDEHAVTFKVETHNHPSAIEPYGGSATGIGGCIRDTMGTGLAAKPIANTDIFCVADPSMSFEVLPKGVLHPKRVLKQVVAGVRDYGNRMGIPTVDGLVYFDDRYLGNPLVFAGSVGLIPNDMCFGDAKPGDRIVALGGRTGRDGIHGATFSSAELTDTHADEFSHAVQIGNAITEKKTLDVILQARDHADGCLYHAITDCGAGGFSSAVGEMGEKVGAFVQLDKAPLKYAGLSYTEIWISEAQERMVVAVPPENIDKLRAIAAAEDVEVCDLGHFGTDEQELVLNYYHHEVGRLSMAFMHDGIPQPVREASWNNARPPLPSGDRPGEGPKDSKSTSPSLNPSPAGREVSDALLALLSHPNIASKHWIIRQYDHEVQGTSVVKPLVGLHQDGPSDASVIRPKLTSSQGVAMSCGLATMLGDVDPYWMTLAAIDEAVRNAVCVGADPSRIAILDNFCWAKCDKPDNLGALVRAAEACYDGALAYRTPFISGKDSLNNQFTKEDGSIIEIPPTLLISAIGIVEDVNECVTMDAKRPGNLLLQVGRTTPQMGGSHYNAITAAPASADIPRVDLDVAPQTLATVAELITRGLVRSAHDCSEGGMLVAAAEMAFAGRLGLDLDTAGVPRDGELTTAAACFAETPTRILIEVHPDKLDTVARTLRDANVPFGQIGTFTDTDHVTLRAPDTGRVMEFRVEELWTAWRTPLNW